MNGMFILESGRMPLPLLPRSGLRSDVPPVGTAHWN
jgi:hypothetical protein